MSKPPPHPFVHHVWPSAFTHHKRFQGGSSNRTHRVDPCSLRKGFHIAVLLNESKCFTELKRTHTQTAKWLKSGLIWLVLRYHSGGVWANRLQRNHWLRWVIGPHARRHRCKKKLSLYAAAEPFLSYLGMEDCASVLWFGRSEPMCGRGRGSCNSFFFFFSVGEGSVWALPTLSDSQENRRMGTESVRHNALLFACRGWRLCILIVNCRPTMWYTL